jgi:twinkle protein
MSEVLSKEQRMFKPKKIEYIKPKPKNKEKEKVFGDSFLDYLKKRGISEKTLIEARVTQETEFMPNIGRAGVIAFNFYVGEELINVKSRSRDKQFKLVGGAELVPYNINSIMPEAYKDGEEKIAIITEGEIDCLTWIECGFKHVISLPNGANNLGGLDNFIESVFDKLDLLYISVDNDTKGIECRNEILRRFGKENCKIIEYPSPCKDINEVMIEYGAEKVIECFKNATDLKPEGIQELVDVESELDYLFKNGLQKGAMVNIPSVDKILSFKTGMLTVVTGVPSHGKTYLLNYLLVRLNLLHNWKMAFFSPEFYPVSLHISQVIETIGGKRFESANYNQMVYEKMKNYLCSNMFWIDPNDTDISSVMERAKYLIKKRGIKVLVIDPFNALTDKERKNQKQDEYISDFLQKLRWFARKYDVSVFLVMHPIKQSKLENGLYPVCDLYSCKGAAEIFDKADCGLTVWRNEKEDYAELHVTKIKFRHLGEKGFATFKFNVNNGRYVEIGEADELRKNGIDIKTMQVEWDNSNYILEKERENQVQSNIVYEENIQPNASFTPQPVQIEEPTPPPLRANTNFGYIPREYIEPELPSDYNDDCPF